MQSADLYKKKPSLFFSEQICWHLWNFSFPTVCVHREGYNRQEEKSLK